MRLKGYHRILILGSPGSGKSTFAKEVAQLTSLPLIHLDDLYWGEDWCRPSHQSWQNELEQVVGNDQWIIDGNHMNTLPIRLERADLVLIMNSVMSRSLYRICVRALKIKLGCYAYLPKRIREQTRRGTHVDSTNDLIGLMKKVVKFHQSDYQLLMQQVLHSEAEKIIVFQDKKIESSPFQPFIEAENPKLCCMSSFALKRAFTLEKHHHVPIVSRNL